MIEGVVVTPLKIIEDERGRVRHFVRSDDPDFIHFGETYITEVYGGMIKAWHGYPTKTIHYAVARGAVKLALYDSRRDSKTFKKFDTIILSDTALYQRVTIPLGVFNGFMGLTDSIVVVTASEPFSEQGILRFPVHYFDYDWSQS